MHPRWRPRSGQPALVVAVGVGRAAAPMGQAGTHLGRVSRPQPLTHLHPAGQWQCHLCHHVYVHRLMLRLLASRVCAPGQRRGDDVMGGHPALAPTALAVPVPAIRDPCCIWQAYAEPWSAKLVQRGVAANLLGGA